MSWTVDYENATHTVRITLAGETTGEDLRHATSEAILKGRSHGTCAFLVNACEIRLHASAFALVALPDQQYPAEGADRRSRVAVIMPTAAREQEEIRFYETACLNRGWHVRCCSSADEGYAWLARRSVVTN